MMKRIFAVSAVAILIVFSACSQSAGTFKDSRDGKTYRTVKIDKMVWMAENLNYAAEGSVCYLDSPDSCAKYGRLYNWDTALKACPDGWSLPSYDEWAALENYAGGEEKAGKKLRSSTGWSYRNVPAGTNNYGFSALPGGLGLDYGNGYFDGAGDYGGWWSATEFDTSRSIYYGIGYSNWDDNDKTNLFSVRCVKD